MLSAFLASIAMFAFVASHGHGALELVNADRATEAALRRATVFNAHTGQGPSQESPTAETETVASPTTPPTRLAASEQGECARRLHTCRITLSHVFCIFFSGLFFPSPHICRRTSTTRTAFQSHPMQTHLSHNSNPHCNCSTRSSVVYSSCDSTFFLSRLCLHCA